jgi:hypothetical protein
MSEPVINFDAAKLMADLRRGDAVAIEQAYRVTFGSDLGRLVLTHHLVECGFGEPLGDSGLKYKAGKIDGALMLAAMARIDPAALAVAQLTDTLEERHDHESSRYSEPPPEDAAGDYFD